MTISTVPSVGVTRLLLNHHFHSFLLTIGDTVAHVNMENPVDSSYSDRWLQTLEIPPSVVLQLHQMLTMALEEYVKAYGAIPQQSGEMIVSQPGRTVN